MVIKGFHKYLVFCLLIIFGSAVKGESLQIKKSDTDLDGDTELTVSVEKAVALYEEGVYRVMIRVIEDNTLLERVFLPVGPFSQNPRAIEQGTDYRLDLRLVNRGLFDLLIVTYTKDSVSNNNQHKARVQIEDVSDPNNKTMIYDSETRIGFRNRG